MGFRYTKFSAKGFSRTTNEDALDIIDIEGGILFILCDGMGGFNGGEPISQLAIKSIKSFFSSQSEGDYLERLRYSVAETNDYIYNRTSVSKGSEKAATTIEVLYLKSGIAFIAHVGDSRIYHIKNSKLKQLTKDHSLVQKLLDEGFLTMLEAENHPEKNVVIKAIGDKGLIETDLMKIKLNQYDVNKFFICSDGITNTIMDFELEKILQKSDMNSITDIIKKIVTDRGASDDYSFIFIEQF